MSHITLFTFSLSILIASAIGLVRYKKIDPAYYPFLYCLWIGGLNEIISFFLITNHQPTAVNNNIYVLFEPVLLVWLFKNWGSFRRTPQMFTALLILFPILWIVENFFISTITHFT